MAKKKRGGAPSPGPANAAPEIPGTLPVASRTRILRGCEALSLLLAAAFLAARPLISAEPFGPAHNVALSCAPLLAWLVAVLARAALAPTLPLPRPSVSVPLAGFLLLVLLSPLIASSTWPAATTAAVWIAHLSLFQLVGLFDRARNLARTLTAVLLASVAIILLQALYQFWVQIPETRTAIIEDPGRMHFIDAALREEFLTRLWTNEPYGPFLTSNTLAGFLAVTFPLVLLPGAWVLRDRSGAEGRSRLRASVFPALGVVAVVLLVLTGSKGGFGAFAVTVAAWTAMEKREALRRHALAITVAAGILAAVGAWAVLGWSADPLGLKNPHSSMGFRLGYWSAAWRMTLEHPVTGVGLDNFADHYLRLKDEAAGEVQRAHNDWLQLAAELGFPGAFLFAAFWFGVIAPSARRGAADPDPPVPPADPEAPPADPGAADALPPSLAAWLGGGAGALAVAATDVAHISVSAVGDLPCFAPVVVVGLWLGVYVLSVRALDRIRFDRVRAGELACALAAGLLGFLAHSAVDMNLYVHGYSGLVFLLGGVLLSLASVPETVPVTPRTRRTALLACALLVLGAIGGWYVVFQRLVPAESLRDEARYGTSTGPLNRDQRRERLLQSVTLNPWDPAAFAALGAVLHEDCRSLGPIRGSHRDLSERILEPCEETAARASASAPHNPALAATLAGVLWDHARILGRHAEQNPREAETDRRGARRALDRALDAVRRAVEGYPGNAHYRHLHARILDDLDRREAARPEYEAALGLSRRQVLERLRLTPETVAQIRARLGG